MSVRKTLMGGLTGALAATGLWVAAPVAHAAVEDDTTFVATADDLIGAGSDTTQHAMYLLANAWNEQAPAPSFKVANFAAFGGGEIPLPSGAIERPNGSTAGKTLLYGDAENTDIDFARSSSSLKDAEKAAGLYLLPFAKDALAMGVASAASNAPASLTEEQIVDIYDGSVTNWSQVGGTAGVIVPLVPQEGSGTRATFLDQLKAMNGGVEVALAASVLPAQEHDDTLVKNDPNAIAPFSVGRAALLGGTVDIVEGWEYKRALYNVVREADLEDAKIEAVFGPEGFVCSDDANELIAESGFQQLDSEADGGVCGVATQDSTSNFQLNEAGDEVVVTTTDLAAKAGVRKVTLTATVEGETTPVGSVTFTEGGSSVGTAPVQGGVATLTLSGVTPGSHTYAAEFVPADAEAFEGSVSGNETVSVTTKATITEGFKAKFKGKSVKGAITVKLAGTTEKATGKVVVKAGKKTVGSGTLKNGKATVTLKKLKKGKNKLTITWAGNDLAGKATTSFTITKK